MVMMRPKPAAPKPMPVPGGPLPLPPKVEQKLEDLVHKGVEAAKHAKDELGDLLEKKGKDIGKATGNLNLPDAAKIGIGLAGGGLLGGAVGAALSDKGGLFDKLGDAVGQALEPAEHAGSAIGDLLHGDVAGAVGEVKDGIGAAVNNVKEGAEKVLSALNPFD